MITIVILYTELMPYNVIVIKALVDRECHVHVVLSDSNKKTPYLPPQLEGVTYYNRSSFWDPDHLFRLVKRLEPDLIWTAGWIDPLYNEVAGKVRKKLHIPVVASSDTQWRGGMQWFNVLVSRFRHRRWFSHLFVSGEPQVAYARKLGFRQEQILMHNLSADVELFHNVDLKMREKEYPRRLVFIGRFSKEKGLAYLLEAWNTIPDRKNWKLVLIGNGPDYPKLKGYPDVEIKDFMPQEELAEELEKAGAFILPSVTEPWALVIHEAACAGLPILASACCGAVSCFVKDGENGFLFKPANKRSIRKAIERFIRLPEWQWVQMGRRSRKLSERITPSKVADCILAVLK